MSQDADIHAVSALARHCSDPHCVPPLIPVRIAKHRTDLRWRDGGEFKC